MLGREDFAVIQSLNVRGVYIKDNPEELAVYPRTVKRASQRGVLQHAHGLPTQPTYRGSSYLIGTWL